MRRTIAGIATSLLAALVISGPMASAGNTAPTTLQCAGSTATECQLLDDLAAQLGPIAPLLGTALAPLTSQAQGLAARSDGAGGVPTAEVVDVSEALLGQLAALPAPVQTLVGAAGLGDLTSTLQALIAAVTAPAVGTQEGAAGPSATPAKASKPSPAPVPFGGTRSTNTSSNTGSSAGAAAPGGSTSSDAVPDVPVGDPLTLAPLALPDFGFDPSFAPAAAIDTAAPSAEKAQLAAVADAMGGGSGAVELAVVAVLSALLLAAAGVAQLQANRHQIPD